MHSKYTANKEVKTGKDCCFFGLGLELEISSAPWVKGFFLPFIGKV
jgi:hypothetical protein